MRLSPRGWEHLSVRNMLTQLYYIVTRNLHAATCPVSERDLRNFCRISDAFCDNAGKCIQRGLLPSAAPSPFPEYVRSAMNPPSAAPTPSHGPLPGAAPFP